MRKSLINLLTAGTIFVSSLFPSRASWNEEKGVYDVSLAPKDSQEVIIEKPLFNTLEEALNFIPESPFEDKRVRINAYPGDYTSYPLKTYTIKNKELVGKVSVVSDVKLDRSRRVVPPHNGAKINGIIWMMSGSRLENIHYLGTKSSDGAGATYSINLSHGILGDELRDCNIINNYLEGGDTFAKILFFLVKKANNVNINGNIFANGMGGISWDYYHAFGYEASGKVKILDNLFYNEEIGIKANSLNPLFLGDENQRGNNIFIRNRKFNFGLYREPSNIPAQYNYWYGIADDVSLKTEESDIFSTFEVLTTNPSSANTYKVKGINSTAIKVIPCNTTEPYPTSRANVWERYK